MEGKVNILKSKFIALGLLLTLGVATSARDMQETLNKARKDFYQHEDADTKTKVEQDFVTGEFYETDSEESIDYKTPVQIVEDNLDEARNRANFFERVVRSIRREESELGALGVVLGREKRAEKKEKAEKAKEKEIEKAEKKAKEKSVKSTKIKKLKKK